MLPVNSRSMTCHTLCGFRGKTNTRFDTAELTLGEPGCSRTRARVWSSRTKDPSTSRRVRFVRSTGRSHASSARIAKTLHLLRFIDVDDTYRRQNSAQHNIQEGHHQLARKIFHGQRGELRQRYREGQEDQLGASAWSSTP